MLTRTVATIATIAALAAASPRALTATDPRPTRASFFASAPQVLEGEAVTLKAVIEAARPADGVPGGQAEFFDGATSLGRVDLTTVDGRGEAVLVASALAIGPHPITVRYDGDGTFGGSMTPPQFVLVLAR